jgi:hypothetical protein
MQKNLGAQSVFIPKLHADQNVLSGRLGVQYLVRVEAQLIEVWKRNGWPGRTNPELPQTEQIEAKLGVGPLQNLRAITRAKDAHFATLFRVRNAVQTPRLPDIAGFRHAQGQKIVRTGHSDIPPGVHRGLLNAVHESLDRDCLIDAQRPLSSRLGLATR